MAGAFLRATAAAALQRRPAAAFFRATAAAALQRRPADLSMVRALSTGKRRGCSGKVCRFDEVKNKSEFDYLRRKMAATQQESSDILDAIRRVEEKQRKPWFTMNFRGRPMHIPGVIALARTAYQVYKRIEESPGLEEQNEE